MWRTGPKIFKYQKENRKQGEIEKSCRKTILVGMTEIPKEEK